MLSVYPLSSLIIAALACSVVAVIATFLFCKHEYLSTIRKIRLEEKREVRKWRQKVKFSFQSGYQQGISKGALERNRLYEENQDLRSQIRMEAWLDQRLLSKGAIHGPSEK